LEARGNPHSTQASQQETIGIGAAKEILAEIFRVQSSDVEEMIQQRLEEKTWPEGREDGVWPATFYLVE